MAGTDVERWTATRLAALPRREGIKYEIVDREPFLVRAADDDHSLASNEIAFALTLWNRQTGLGFVMPVPGLLLGEYDDVIPDVVWVSRDMMAALAESPAESVPFTPIAIGPRLTTGRSLHQALSRERRA